MSYGSETPGQRPGLTLVELVVVVFIITMLMAFASGTGYRVAEAVRTSSTENALRTIQGVLNAQWNAVIHEAATEDMSPTVLAYADGHPVRARAMWTKLRLREAFPVSYNDVRTTQLYRSSRLNQFAGPWLLRPRYRPGYFAALPPSGMRDRNPDTESAACLFLALKVNRGGVELDERNLAGFIMDTDGDGVKEFVDAWGRSLRFARFTTYPLNTDLAQLNPRLGTPKEVFGDPIDPDGTFQQFVGGKPWCQTFHGGSFNVMCGFYHHYGGRGFPYYVLPSGRPTRQPYYQPYIVSAGPDGIFGTDDDIYSYKLK